MQIYPYWKALFMSFGSASLYRDNYKNWKGRGFLYLLLLTTVISCIMSISWFLRIKSFDHTQVAKNITKTLFDNPDLTFEQSFNRIINILGQFPDIEFKDGTLNIKEEKNPYIITDPINQEPFAIFDTTGQYSSIQNTNTIILITKNRLIVKSKANNYEEMTIQEIEDQGRVGEDDINEIFYIIKQIPSINITNGVATTDAKEPYFIDNYNKKEVAVIDTEGSYNTLEGSSAYLLLNSDRVLIKNPLEANAVENIKLSELNSDVVANGLIRILSFIKSAILWTIPLIVAPLFIASYFFFSIILLFSYSVVGVAITKFMRLENFTYEKILRLSALAITPTLILNFILPHIFNNQGLIYFLVSVGYIYFAIKVNAEA